MWRFEGIYSGGAKAYIKSKEKKQTLMLAEIFFAFGDGEEG
jgi:hypothetical protein